MWTRGICYGRRKGYICRNQLKRNPGIPSVVTFSEENKQLTENWRGKGGKKGRNNQQKNNVEGTCGEKTSDSGCWDETKSMS